MVVEQIQTAMVVMVLAAAATVTTAVPATTFLAVAQDLAPPPSAPINTTKTPVSLAQCGQLCYAAKVERCRAFVWRPLTPPQVLVCMR